MLPMMGGEEDPLGVQGRRRGVHELSRCSPPCEQGEPWIPGVLSVAVLCDVFL